MPSQRSLICLLVLTLSLTLVFIYLRSFATFTFLESVAFDSIDGPKESSLIGPTENINEAYVLLCTNMRTVYPALVVFFQLCEKMRVKRKLVVMIPDNLALRVGPLFRALNVQTRTLPQSLPVTINYPVQSSSTRKRDRVLWNKLFAWELVEFTKILLLDADLLVQDSIDELFELDCELGGVPALDSDEKILFWDPPEPFEADPLDTNSWKNFTKPTRFERMHSGLNGGVMLLRPSHNTFQNLWTAASMLRERTCCPTQEFIYRYFELLGQYHRLSPVYNMRKEHRLSEEDCKSWGNVKIYHFVEKKKPWIMGRIESIPHKFATLWWKCADRTDNFLDQMLKDDDELLGVLREARHAAISSSKSSI